MGQAAVDFDLVSQRPPSKEKLWPKISLYIPLQALKKKRGKDKTWLHPLKNSHLVKEGKVTQEEVREQVEKCNKRAEKGEVSGSWDLGTWLRGARHASRMLRWAQCPFGPAVRYLALAS